MISASRSCASVGKILKLGCEMHLRWKDIRLLVWSWRFKRWASQRRKKKAAIQAEQILSLWHIDLFNQASHISPKTNKYTDKPVHSSWESEAKMVCEEKVRYARPSSCLSQSNTSLARRGLFGSWSICASCWIHTTNRPIVIRRAPESSWFAAVFLACLGSWRVTNGRGGLPSKGILTCTFRLDFEYVWVWVARFLSFAWAESSVAAPSAAIEMMLIPASRACWMIESCRAAISSAPSFASLARRAHTNVGVFGNGTWRV